MIADALGVAAVVLAACGLFLVFLDITPVQAEPSPIRLRLGAMWGALATIGLMEVPRTAVAGAVRATDRFIYYWFEQSERNVATSGGFTLVVLVAIPLAALLNWLRGGSPFLIVVILACVAGFAILAVLSETRRAPRVAEALTPVLCAVVLLFLPGYVFVSLTAHTLHTPIGHAALFSILVAPLLYFICHSTVLIGSGASGAPLPSLHAGIPRRLATLFIATLPITYLLVFACLVLGHVAAPEEAVPATWQALLIGMAAGAVAATATLHLARGPRAVAGVGLASLIAIAAAAITAAASPWLVAVPLAPPLILWAGAILALLAKISVSVMGAEQAVRRPYMVAGVSGLVIAAAASWAAIVS
jgi:hypothetical protein